MSKSREQLIDALLSSQKQVSALLESVADDQDWQPDSEEWSFRFTAAHLATVEKECFLDRVTRIASGDNPQFSYYLNTGRDFSQFDLRQSLQDWGRTRQGLIGDVQALSEDKLVLTGTHVKFGIMTILDVLQLLLDHDLEHLQELEAILTLYRQQSIEKRCEAEVIELHQFFQDWFNGEIEPTNENYARLVDVLSADFILIDPGGNITGGESLLARLRNAHNSRRDFKIWVENFQFRHYEDHIAIATYEEWQIITEGETNARLSTAIFREKAGTPNGVMWLHVHETWLKE